MKKITSLNNETIKRYCKLNQKKYRYKDKKFIIEGLKQIREANDYIEVIITTDENYSSQRYEVIYVDETVMYKIYQQKPVVKYIAICRLVNSQFDQTDVVILNEIKDPGNLGNIIRTAVSLGYRNILIDDKSVDLYNDKVIRAAHGSLFKINILQADAYEFLLVNDYHVVTTFLDEESNFEYNNHKLAIVFGNEAKGIDEKFKNIDHSNFKIDIIFESLNVASAGAIVLYDLKRRMK